MTNNESRDFVSIFSGKGLISNPIMENCAEFTYSGTSLEGTRHQGKSQSKGQWCSVPTFSLKFSIVWSPGQMRHGYKGNLTL